MHHKCRVRRDRHDRLCTELNVVDTDHSTDWPYFVSDAPTNVANDKALYRHRWQFYRTGDRLSDICRQRHQHGYQLNNDRLGRRLREQYEFLQLRVLR